MNPYSQPNPSGFLDAPRAYSAYSEISCSWSNVIDTGSSAMSSTRPCRYASAA